MLRLLQSSCVELMRFGNVDTHGGGTEFKTRNTAESQKKLADSQPSEKMGAMKRFSSVCVMTLFFVAVGPYAAFAKAQMPTGEEIAKAAKAAKLNSEASATAKKDGQKVTVTSMDFSKIKTPKDLEKGQVVAVIAVKGVRGLPNGKYDVFLIKTNDRWHAFFESGGKIVKEDNHVEVSSTKSDGERVNIRPVIEMPPPPGFCADICFGTFPRVVCIRKICYLPD
jgi:hypothetical protein